MATIPPRRIVSFLTVTLLLVLASFASGCDVLQAYIDSGSTSAAAPPIKATAVAKGDPARGAAVFVGDGGCNFCHDVSAGTIVGGPSLKGIAATAATRKPPMTAEEYLHESIMNPNIYLVEGYVKNSMFDDYGESLKAEQIADLVAYMLTLK
jgi:cytochrome c551/c552